MAKISNRTANPFIWMANSIGEIVEKQKNEPVTLLLGQGQVLVTQNNQRRKSQDFCRILQEP
jgi:hypothetical protein